MLLIILFSLLTLFLLVNLIILIVKKDDDYILFVGPLMISSLFLCIMSCLCISVNSEEEINKVTNNYYTGVRYFSKKYNSLLKDLTNEKAVDEYNKELDEYIYIIKDNKNRLKNIWVNWFTCPAYKNFDLSIFKRINFTITISM